MVKPRCPFCNVQGIEKIASQKLGPALLVYCGQCGAIHGIIPLPQKPKKAEIKTEVSPRAAPAPGQASGAPGAPGAPDAQKDKKPTPAEEALSFWTQPGQHGFYTRLVTDEE